jgi:hypothetical protein
MCEQIGAIPLAAALAPDLFVLHALHAKYPQVRCDAFIHDNVNDHGLGLQNSQRALEPPVVLHLRLTPDAYCLLSAVCGLCFCAPRTVLGPCPAAGLVLASAEAVRWRQNTVNAVIMIISLR